MTTPPDALAFLQAICTDPDDDTPRMVFADWLDEHATGGELPCPTCSQYAADPDNPFRGPGYRPERDPASGRHEGGWANCKACNGGGTRGSRPGIVRAGNGFAERADFIRVQIALSRSTCAPGLCVRTCDCDRLRRRERGLLEWWGDYVSAPCGVDCCDNSGVRFGAVGVTFRRGFAAEFRLTAADWLAHASQLFWHPDQRVPCNRCFGGGDGVDVTGCRSCDSTGETPRPFPPTAQPIERVTLTTWPHERDFGTIEHMGWATMTARYYRWPGITFRLPAGA